jgi:hypothetical protein
MHEHKIQSSGGLVLDLNQVPKLLGDVTGRWAKDSYVVSFKLETDERLIIDKAAQAIDKYGVHLVIANMLQTRRDICYIVESSTEGPAVVDFTDSFPQQSVRPVSVQTMSRPENMKNIEPAMVLEVVKRHRMHFVTPDGTLSNSTVKDDSIFSLASNFHDNGWLRHMSVERLQVLEQLRTWIENKYSVVDDSVY